MPISPFTEISHENLFGKARRGDRRSGSLIDAKGLVVGRLATIVAMRLRGKHLPTYTPHVDCGDNVIIVNAAQVVLTGRKREQQGLLQAHRFHRRHQGAHREARSSRAASPSACVEKAVERMIPRGPLGRVQMGNLRVYAGAEHPHEAQNAREGRYRFDEPQEHEGRIRCPTPCSRSTSSRS